MSDKLENVISTVKQEEKQSLTWEEIDARIEAKLNKQFNLKSNNEEETAKELVLKKLALLEKSGGEKEDLEASDAVFEDAMQSEQDHNNLLRKRSNDSISDNEQKIIESIYRVSRMLDADDYNYHLFNSNNTSEQAEQIRRMCVHIKRWAEDPKAFLVKFKEFSLTGYNNFK